MISLLYALSVGLMGIFAGTQIAEGALLVPYWKQLKPADFFILHQTYGPKIYRFFAPLTIITTLLSLGTAIYATWVNATGSEAAQVAAVFTLLFFATYPLYFKKANQQFADASISTEALPNALNRWGQWHWGRVCLEVLALGAWLTALVQI